MLIIPVIDIRGGVAVAARGGDRANYRPLVTPLAASADPLDVAIGYGALFPFPVLYIADLDGIEGRGANQVLQRRIAEAWGGEEVWIDDGSTECELPPTAAIAPRVARVMGSESVASVSDLAPGLHSVPSPETSSQSRPGPRSTRAGHEDSWLGPGLRRGDKPDRVAGSSHDREAEDRIVLSLDFRGDEFLGPRELLEDAGLWPERVIVMTLARVGAAQGPDLARVSEIVCRAGSGRHVYAAGGIRDLADLKALNAAGAAGALVATALHAGQIKTGDLQEIAG
jgi:phosphoribosylformimino-5-aminoimidazole carboxamide ribotide isomerase